MRHCDLDVEQDRLADVLLPLVDADARLDPQIGDEYGVQPAALPL
jgi:hypothetical protein